MFITDRCTGIGLDIKCRSILHARTSIYQEAIPGRFECNVFSIDFIHDEIINGRTRGKIIIEVYRCKSVIKSC